MENLRILSIINRAVFRNNSSNNTEIADEENKLVAEVLSHDANTGLTKVRYKDGSTGFQKLITTGTTGAFQPITVKSSASPIPKADAMPTRRIIQPEVIPAIPEITPSQILVRMFAIGNNGDATKKVIRCVGSECVLVGTFELTNDSEISGFTSGELIFGSPNAIDELSSFFITTFSPYSQLKNFSGNTETFSISRNTPFTLFTERNEWSNQNTLLYLGKNSHTALFARQTQFPDESSLFIFWAFSFCKESLFTEYLTDVLATGQQQTGAQYRAELISISILFTSPTTFRQPLYNNFKNYSHDLPFPRINNLSGRMVRIGNHSYSTFLPSPTAVGVLIDVAIQNEQMICDADVAATNEGVIVQKVDISRTFTQRFYLGPRTTTMTYSVNKNDLVYEQDGVGDIVFDTSGDWLVSSTQPLSNNKSDEDPTFIGASELISGYQKFVRVPRFPYFTSRTAGSSFPEFNGMNILNFVSASGSRGIVKGTITNGVVVGIFSTSGQFFLEIELFITVNTFIDGVDRASFNFITDGHPYAFFLSRTVGDAALSNYAYYWDTIAPSISNIFFSESAGEDEIRIRAQQDQLTQSAFPGHCSQDRWDGDTIFRLAQKRIQSAQTTAVLETWQIVSNRIVYQGSEVVNVDSCFDSLSIFGTNQQVVLGASLP